jgi:hypothetical protein
MGHIESMEAKDVTRQSRRLTPEVSYACSPSSRFPDEPDSIGGHCASRRGRRGLRQVWNVPGRIGALLHHERSAPRLSCECLPHWRGGAVMDDVLTLPEIKAKARNLRAKVVSLVIFANDRIVLVEAGPRGGWHVLQ